MGETPDLSMLFDMLSNSSKENSGEAFDISKLTHILSDSSKKQSNTTFSDNQENPAMPDMETIMRISQIAKSINTPSPSKTLLYSLKPFLNNHRKEKIDTYAKLLGMTSILDILKSEKGEKNE